MKVKAIFMGVGALFAATAFAATHPTGTQLFNGDRIEPVAMSLVDTSTEHLNFCAATRFSDGTIYMSHSAGVHTVTERPCKHWSPDNGKTWLKLDANCRPTYQTKDGRKCSFHCWNDKVTDRHTIKRLFLAPDGKSVTTESSELVMPFRSTLRLNSFVRRLRDGRLLICGYGRKENARRFFSVVLESKDDGKSWNYLSTILEDPAARMPEGPNECEVIELANGQVLAYVRTGSQAPLLQLRSSDGGKSWGAPEEILPFGVFPTAKILANGTLVLITGRPKLYLLVDFTGTGRNYQRFLLYGGSGSSYASILETEPNRLMVIYDESDFGSWRNQALFSRVVAMTLDVVRDDAARRPVTNDPEAAKYEHYYSPASGLLPGDQRVFMPSGYQPAGKAGSEAYYEINRIAERPHPVLRLVHQGVTSHKFSSFHAPMVEDAEKISAGFEFRLGDAAEKRPQFRVLFSFQGKNGAPNRFGWVAFGTENIMYHSAGKLVKFPFAAGTTAFHAFTLDADCTSGTYRLFRKGEKQPLFTAKLTQNREIMPGFSWGDGSSDVFGVIDLSYIGFTSR